MLYYDIAEPTLVTICFLELTYNIGYSRGYYVTINDVLQCNVYMI